MKGILIELTLCLIAIMIIFFAIREEMGAPSPIYKQCMKAHRQMIISDETFDYWDSFCIKEATQ